MKLDPIKSKIIGMLHSLEARAGESRFSDGDYIADEITKIIQVAGTLPDLEENVEGKLAI